MDFPVLAAAVRDRLSVRPVEVAARHRPHVSRPDEVASLLDR